MLIRLDKHKLQLGHAGEGVEIPRGNRKLNRSGGLQLGHAGEGVEISWSCSGTLHLSRGASIGPRR